MLQKFLIILFPLVGSFVLAWYGNFTGKLPAKGTYLGIPYDSIVIRAIVTQFEYLWLLIAVNILFTLLFRLGLESFKNNFLPVAIIWVSAGPVAALAFNTLVLKDKITWIALIGIILLILGSVLVIAQKEIIKLFS